MSQSSMKVRWMTGLPAGLAFSVAGLIPSTAQTTPAPAVDSQQSAYRSSIAQETVRKQADKIQAELGQLVTELKLNGIDTGSLKTLSAASTHLSGLSQEEMQKVINSLQSASIAGDDSKRQQSMVSAYQGQQDLVLKLKKLATALAMQQAGDKLINQLEALIARQSANIRQTTVLTTAGHTAAQLDAKEKNLHDVATSEQTAIGGQIDLLFTSLAAQTSQPAQPGEASDANAETAKSVLDAMNGSLLKDTSQMAIQITSAGPFPDAVAKQTAVKQYLVGVLKAAESKADASTRLTQAKSQLDQVLADQKALSDLTKDGKVDPATLAQRQAELNDRADVAKALVSPLNPDAAKKVDEAQKDMQQSTDALNDPKKQQEAAAKQDDAAKALADADKTLDQQIAAVQQQQNQSPTDQMAQIQKAIDEVKQAQQEQNVSPQDAAKDAQKAQQDALAQSPDAASKLADAADKLQQQAQQNQPNQQSQQNQPGQQNQQAQNQQGQQPQQQTGQQPNDASKDLAQAAQDLQAQKDALAQAAQDYQALAQANQALDQAAKDAAAADQNLQNSANNSPTDTAHKLADAQAQVAQAQQASNLPGAAQQAMQQAADALKNGLNQAVQANASGADAQTKQAMSALQQAQSAVGQAMAQISSQSQQQRGQGQGQQQMAQNNQNQQSQGQQLGGTGMNDSQAVLKGSGQGSVQRGTALVVGGLTPKDRDAISQYQAEKTPAEYAPLVQQYLKNLADASESH